MGLSEEFVFSGELWEWPGPAAWCFASLPIELTDDIDERFGHLAAGFGSIRVEVTVGSSTWRTSVFPDSKRGMLILPVKKSVRKKEGLDYGDTAQFTIAVVTDELRAN